VLASIARTARSTQIFYRMCTPFAQWNDMIELNATGALPLAAVVTFKKGFCPNPIHEQKDTLRVY